MRKFRRVGVSVVLMLAVAAPVAVSAADRDPVGEAGAVANIGDDAQLAICFPDVCMLLDSALPGPAAPDATVDPAVAEPFPEGTPAAPEAPTDGDPDRPFVDIDPEDIDLDLADLITRIVDGEEPPDFEALGLDLLSGAELWVIEAGAEFDRPTMRATADGDLSGTWKVTNRKATMLCSAPSGGGRLSQPLKKTVDTVKIAHNDEGILVGEGLAKELVDMTRLAPGVYGMEYSAKQKGQTVETRSFLGMDSEDAFTGTTMVRVSGKKSECTMTRGFKGKRTR